MTIVINHKIGQNIAKERIVEFLNQKAKENTNFISNYEANWTGYSGNIKATAKNINFNGTIDIGMDSVRIETVVPLVFSMFKSKVKHVIVEEVSKILY